MDILELVPGETAEVNEADLTTVQTLPNVAQAESPALAQEPEQNAPQTCGCRWSNLPLQDHPMRTRNPAPHFGTAATEAEINAAMINTNAETH